MAHYALIDSNNIVVEVITGVDENIIQSDLDGTQVGGTTQAWETFYESQPQFAGLICKRTSYNGNIRGINYTTYQWEAPVAKPDDVEGYLWKWSEYNKEWIQTAT
jgi:hypothetical protein